MAEITQKYIQNKCHIFSLLVDSPGVVWTFETANGGTLLWKAWLPYFWPGFSQKRPTFDKNKFLPTIIVVLPKHSQREIELIHTLKNKSNLRFGAKATGKRPNIHVPVPEMFGQSPKSWAGHVAQSALVLVDVRSHVIGQKTLNGKQLQALGALVASHWKKSISSPVPSKTGALAYCVSSAGAFCGRKMWFCWNTAPCKWDRQAFSLWCAFEDVPPVCSAWNNCRCTLKFQQV